MDQKNRIQRWFSRVGDTGGPPMCQCLHESENGLSCTRKCFMPCSGQSKILLERSLSGKGIINPYYHVEKEGSLSIEDKEHLQLLRNVIKGIPHWGRTINQMKQEECIECFAYMEKHETVLFADVPISLKRTMVHEAYLDREEILARKSKTPQ